MPSPRRLLDRFGPEDTRLGAALVVISAVAWLMMVMSHAGPGSAHGLHGQLGSLLSAPNTDICTSAPAGAGGNVFLPDSASWIGGWTIMVVAMMLPPAMPLLRALARLADTPSSRRVQLFAAGTAFLCIWVLAGVALLALGTAATHALRGVPALADNPALISGIAALVAGAYQLSPWKEACLTACRSPTGMLLLHWQGSQPVRSATGVGVRYALVCIGCCWALMLVTLTVGAFALPLMVVVSIVMLLERVLPAVRPLVALQAALACLLGLLLLLGALPPGLTIASQHTPNHLGVDMGDDHVRHQANPFV